MTTLHDQRAAPLPLASPSESRRGLALVVIAAVLTLLVAEAGAHVVARRLPETLTWPDAESQHKVAAMDALGTRGGASTVLVGSSMTEAGGDPRLLTGLLRPSRPVFNAALNGADLRVLEKWSTRVVVPKLHPKTLVIGLSSHEFNDNGKQQKKRYSGFLTAPSARVAFGRGTIVDRVELAADRHSDLVKYRSRLRNPYLALTKQYKKQLGNQVTPLGSLKGLVVFSSSAYRFTDAFRRLNTQDTLFHFKIGPVETGALERMITRLHQQHVNVVVVEMPLTDDAVALHPRGAADIRDFEVALQAIVTKAGARLVNMQPEFTDHSWFSDPYHLNAKGRARFSTLLAQALR